MSGDTSCADHINAWRVRDALGLDFISAGVSTTNDDNLILASPVAPNSFQHPTCLFPDKEVEVIGGLPTSAPIGSGS